MLVSFSTSRTRFGFEVLILARFSSMRFEAFHRTLVYRKSKANKKIRFFQVFDDPALNFEDCKLTATYGLTRNGVSHSVIW